MSVAYFLQQAILALSQILASLAGMIAVLVPALSLSSTSPRARADFRRLLDGRCQGACCLKSARPSVKRLEYAAKAAGGVSEYGV